MIGRTLSHYRIVAELGSGGMGTVYRADDTLLGRAVALKFPHRELVHEPDARARFLREARAASALDHPGIVVLYDVCDVEGEVFLAMQYVEGVSLREKLRVRPLPVAESLGIGRAVADALAHAHSRGVVHRDIKPENILLAPDGRVKVADFGTARFLEEASHTRTGDMVGTLFYLPPEVIRGEPADARSDLYELGALLYELCAGAPPFTGDSFAAVLYRSVNEEPAPLPASVPPSLQRLIRDLLSKDPAQRPASAVAVADELARLTAGPAAAGAPAVAIPARSIAVLYFENLTGNPDDDYFCAGMTEDLLTDLLKIPDLQVASRSAVAALRGKTPDLKQVGRDLGVATVLEGSVRRAGGRIRVTAQLIRADTGYHLWAERYDRQLEDVFDVQEDIARQIAGALRLVFEPGEGEVRNARRTRSPRAYDLRLQALARYRRFEDADMREAIGLLERAVREDPDYALGRADLAECCVQMVCKSWEIDHAWLDRAEAEARRALALAPALPDGYRALGHVWMHRRRPDLALLEFHHAVDLDPRFADGLAKLATSYLYLGDASRAEVYVRRALSADPEETRAHGILSAVLLSQRRLAECREAARAALALPLGRWLRLALFHDLLFSHVWEGQADAVGRVGQEIEREFGENAALSCALLACAAAFAGRREEAHRLLASPALANAQEADAFVNAARARMLLGERDAALDALERAQRYELVDLDELRTDPQLTALRGEPRFEKILAPLAEWAPARHASRP